MLLALICCSLLMPELLDRLSVEFPVLRLLGPSLLFGSGALLLLWPFFNEFGEPLLLELLLLLLLLVVFAALLVEELALRLL